MILMPGMEAEAGEGSSATIVPAPATNPAEYCAVTGDVGAYERENAL
jgi:hypothetical protein